MYLLFTDWCLCKNLTGSDQRMETADTTTTAAAAVEETAVKEKQVISGHSNSTGFKFREIEKNHFYQSSSF